MNLRRRFVRPLALGSSLVVASSLAGGASLADEKADCMAAASKGQTLRDAHALVEAREQFRVCARRECPAIVQTDCGPWLEEVERMVPSVVLSAKDGEGRDLLDVSVTADGAPLAQELDGQAVPMNPGVHSFEFTLADGTTAASRVIVKEGEKAQAVSVVLRPASVVVPGDAPKEGMLAPPTTPDAETAKPNTPAPGTTRGAIQRVLGLVLGGVGLVGLGVGGGVALDAKSKDVTAAGEGGSARQTDSQNAVSQGNAGTVVIVAGAVVAAAGIVLWVTAPSAKVAVGMDGRELLLRGTF
jgi:hypothetical protein